MLIKGIKYSFYMIFARLKGLKYEHIKKTKGIEEATEYSAKSIYLWSKFTINIIGMNIKVVGKENIPKDACVFVGNHTSILDIPVIFYSADRHIGFISKKEVLKVPVLSYWLERDKCIALDRQNPRDGVRMKTLPFKKGSMKLAIKAKAPIVPVTIDSSFTSFEKNNKFKPSTVIVTFHKAIETANITKDEEKDLAENVRNIIISSLRDEYKN